MKQRTVVETLLVKHLNDREAEHTAQAERLQAVEQERITSYDAMQMGYDSLKATINDNARAQTQEVVKVLKKHLDNHMIARADAERKLQGSIDALVAVVNQADVKTILDAFFEEQKGVLETSNETYTTLIQEATSSFDQLKRFIDEQAEVPYGKVDALSLRIIKTRTHLNFRPA